MEGMNPFVAIMVFVAGLAFTESLLLMVSDSRRVNRNRVRRARLKRHASRIQAREDIETESIFLETATRGPILKWMAGLVPNRKPLDLWLYRSGVRMQLEFFLGMTLLFAIAGSLAANLARGVPAYTIIAGLVMGTMPFLYIRSKKKKRMDLFNEEFPEAIELLCRSLQAGHPFQTGLRLVAEEIDEPVASELSQVVDEIGMGLDLRTALSNLAIRVNTEEMPFFLNAVLVQRETGGDLAGLLFNLGNTARERLQFQTKVKAIVSQTATSANVLATFPAIFMGLISWAAPGYMDPLFEPGVGRVILIVAGGLTAVGWILSRRLTQVRI